MPDYSESEFRKLISEMRRGLTQPVKPLWACYFRQSSWRGIVLDITDTGVVTALLILDRNGRPMTKRVVRRLSAAHLCRTSVCVDMKHVNPDWLDLSTVNPYHY